MAGKIGFSPWNRPETHKMGLRFTHPAPSPTLSAYRLPPIYIIWITLKKFSLSPTTIFRSSSEKSRRRDSPKEGTSPLPYPIGPPPFRNQRSPHRSKRRREPAPSHNTVCKIIDGYLTSLTNNEVERNCGNSPFHSNNWRKAAVHL